MDYRHTQIGKTAALVFLWGLIIVFIVAVVPDEGAVPALTVGGLFVLLGAVALIFNRLAVTVAAGTVKAAFGWGWPRRVVEVRDVAAFRPVRNKWYYGWGIRKIPGGWMFNVWGLDAVEIELRSGKKVRIGTDESAELVTALSLHTSLRLGGNS